MRKRFMGLGLALLLTLASSMTAGAEELQGESGWQVSFNGKKMESNFASAWPTRSTPCSREIP